MPPTSTVRLTARGSGGRASREPPRGPTRRVGASGPHSWRRLELAVDDDPSSGEVLTVDGECPQRPACVVAPDAQRHADRHRLVEVLEDADGPGHGAVDHGPALRADVGEVPHGALTVCWLCRRTP